MKKWYTSKTMWASFGTIVTSIGLLLSGEQTSTEWFIGAMGIVFGFLRTITDEPVGK